MELSFDEIKDGDIFEDLVVSLLEDQWGKAITNVQQSGKGTDGGRDILLTLTQPDISGHFERKWVIQCKFHKNNISTDKIADINIPTLLHSYGAVGYLLVCRSKPTSKLTDLFERLEKECIFGRSYKIWSGEQVKSFLLRNEPILQQYFPKYFEYYCNYIKKEKQ